MKYKSIIKQVFFALLLFSNSVTTQAQQTELSWSFSKAFTLQKPMPITYPGLFAMHYAQWGKEIVSFGQSTSLNQYKKEAQNKPHMLFAKTTFLVNADQESELQLTSACKTGIFLNGILFKTGNFKDEEQITLKLHKGINEILLAFTEIPEDCKFNANIKGDLSQIANSSITLKISEVNGKFGSPESAVYDKKRDIIYISNYVISRDKPIGFISKLNTDGKISDLHWIDSLNAPTGLCIDNNMLYVVERTGIAIIDIDTGKIKERIQFPPSRFLNDIIKDSAGTFYVTNTALTPEETDVYRISNNTVEKWLTEPELNRLNGISYINNSIYLGNSGGGTLVKVNTETKKFKTVVHMGGGIIDGIKKDHEGNMLISHWRGQLYKCFQDGEIVKLIDFENKCNTADFEIIEEKKLLIIPGFLGKKVLLVKY